MEGDDYCGSCSQTTRRFMMTASLWYILCPTGLIVFNRMVEQCFGYVSHVQNCFGCCCCSSDETEMMETMNTMKLTKLMIEIMMMDGYVIDSDKI
jgi:hypothetical protein